MKYWTEINSEEEAREKIICGGQTDEQFTRDNAADIALMDQVWKIKETDIVLDFGCGIGRLMKVIGPRVSKIWGIDISRKIIHLAKESYYPKGNYYLMKGKLDIPSYITYDKIYSTLCLQHIEKAEVYCILKILKKILKQEGEVLLQFSDLEGQDVNLIDNYWIQEGKGQVEENKSPLMRFYLGRELEIFFDLLGFKDVKIIKESRKDRIWVYAKNDESKNNRNQMHSV